MQPILHPTTTARLKSIAKRPQRSFLFVGPAGIGRRPAAAWLLMLAGCPDQGCLVCRYCRTVESGNNPDLITIEPTGTTIGIAQIQELIHSLKVTPYGQLRLVLINEAHKLTPEAQNACLKLMEEPPPATGIVLVTHSPNQLLPTVRSRLETITFVLPEPLAASQALAKLTGLPSQRVAAALEAADGLPGVAIQLLTDQQLADERAELDSLAGGLLAADAFSRLARASQLLEGERLMGVVGALARRLRRQLRLEKTTETTSQTGRRLAALERFYRYREANVNSRAALERLLLELE